MPGQKIGTREEWRAARERAARREKEHTRLGDELARQRRELPWVPLEKEYRFDTDDGERTLAELFDGRSQLIVYHFMFGPDYKAGCPTCSSTADSFNGALPHLRARDVTFISSRRRRSRSCWPTGGAWAGASRGPRRASDFNFDLGFSSTRGAGPRGRRSRYRRELPPIAEHNARASGADLYGYLTERFGFSAFALEDGTVYHTYSTTGRGVEFLMAYYPILDHVPQGRAEGADWQTWIRRHDEYEEA